MVVTTGFQAGDAGKSPPLSTTVPDDHRPRARSPVWENDFRSEEGPAGFLSTGTPRPGHVV